MAVHDTVYLSGYRCARCRFPIADATARDLSEPEYHDLADFLTNSRHGGCGEAGRWQRDPSIQAVVLEDGTGPFIVHDCPDH